MALTRLQVLSFSCPTCRVGPEKLCRRTTDGPDDQGTRYSCHEDRRILARLSGQERKLATELRALRKQLRPLKEAASGEPRRGPELAASIAKEWRCRPCKGTGLHDSHGSTTGTKSCTVCHGKGRMTPDQKARLEADAKRAGYTLDLDDLGLS